MIPGIAQEKSHQGLNVIECIFWFILRNMKDNISQQYSKKDTKSFYVDNSRTVFSLGQKLTDVF